jgi:hypothetical protein
MLLRLLYDRLYSDSVPPNLGCRLASWFGISFAPDLFYDKCCVFLVDLDSTCSRVRAT